MVSRKVKIVVAGATGLIGRRHLQHVIEEPEAELVGIIDPDTSAQDLAFHHDCYHFNSVKGLLDAVKAGYILADAAILATPTPTHAPLAQELLEANIAVLVEKPFTLTGNEGRAILKAYRLSIEAGGTAVVMVGHHRRHNSYTIAVKKAIEEGRLGDVIAVNGVWAMRKPAEYFAVPWRQEAGSGGVILNNASHEIDILQYLLGDITQVYAIEGRKQREFPVDETVQVTFTFASGVVGSFLFSDSVTSPHSWEAATGENPHIPTRGETCLTIFGTQATISIPSLTRFHQDALPAPLQNWTTPLSLDNSLAHEQASTTTPPLTRQLKHFIKAVRDEVPPNCSGEDGLKVVLVIEAIFKSLEHGRPVLVDRL